MKKKVAFIGILSLVAFGTFAQYGNRNDDNLYSSRNRNYNESFERSDKNDNKWGYDNDHNVVRSNKAMMIDSYQRQAKMRIGEGVRRGSITRFEADKLMKYYYAIERKENRFMRNGRISRSEARELNNDLEHLNRMITKESRDFQRSRGSR